MFEHQNIFCGNTLEVRHLTSDTIPSEVGYLGVKPTEAIADSIAKGLCDPNPPYSTDVTSPAMNQQPLDDDFKADVLTSTPVPTPAHLEELGITMVVPRDRALTATELGEVKYD